MNEEMTEHLGHEKNRVPDGLEAANVRNGTRSKTVLTESAGAGRSSDHREHPHEHGPDPVRLPARYSDAGIRDVAIPPHLLPAIKQHLDVHTGPGKDALLFPATAGGHMAASTLYKVYYPARDAVGREDLRWHDLRHTGAVFAAQTGATLAELMGRLGHSTPAAAMRYQHAARDRDTEIAKALSAMVSGGK